MILAVAVPLFIVWLVVGIAGWVDFSIFLTLMFIGFAVIWVAALVDLFRRADLGTAAKIIWAVAMLLFPILGPLVYAVARPPAAEIAYTGETQT
jgi:hypothetical protein